jgi:DNA polymerase III alpha subunit
MRLTNFKQVIVNEEDIVSALYSGKIADLTNLLFEDPELVTQFNLAVTENAEPIQKLKLYKDSQETQEEFDRRNQAQWFMPYEYQTYDIVDWLYCECRTIEQKDRVTEELRLFAQHNMIDLLKYIKYLVDTMRKNNIVWGVGRGSSVASYVLYLIGIHKIDSIKYGLDINEFLKGEEDGKV